MCNFLFFMYRTTKLHISVYLFNMQNLSIAVTLFFFYHSGDIIHLNILAFMGDEYSRMLLGTNNARRTRICEGLNSIKVQVNYKPIKCQSKPSHPTLYRWASLLENLDLLHADDTYLQSDQPLCYSNLIHAKVQYFSSCTDPESFSEGV